MAVLKGYGYSVLEASGGFEALSLIERHGGKIDLMLADIVMPEMSGPELVERAAKLRPAMAVVLMSGYPGEVLNERVTRGPMSDYLLKPFTPESLGSRVREALGPQRFAARILVVDDEQGICRLFERILAQQGYEVSSAADGSEALQALSEQRFDLMITDLVMPTREGIETIQAVRKLYPD